MIGNMKTPLSRWWLLSKEITKTMWRVHSDTKLLFFIWFVPLQIKTFKRWIKFEGELKNEN